MVYLKYPKTGQHGKREFLLSYISVCFVWWDSSISLQIEQRTNVVFIVPISNEEAIVFQCWNSRGEICLQWENVPLLTYNYRSRDIWSKYIDTFHILRKNAIYLLWNKTIVSLLLNIAWYLTSRPIWNDRSK